MGTSTLSEYQGTIQRLDTFVNFERNPAALAASGFGTERMANLMRRIGSPHLTMPAVHIAGTKGKGSTAHMVAAALAATGLRVGLYTSPHVVSLRERIMLGKRQIGERQFALAARPVLKAAEDMRADGREPSYFEALTAIALQAFQNADMEALVIETGLGGRLDATNLPDLPVVATGISAVSLDHETILGRDLAAIAAEKAGIIRKNTPVATSVSEPTALAVVAARATELDSPFFRVGEDVPYRIRQTGGAKHPDRGQRIDFETWRAVYPDIPLPLIGPHQAENAALALALAELFLDGSSRGPLRVAALKSGWRHLNVPARYEIIGKRPWFVVDGGHNPAAAWAAAEATLECFPAKKRILVFGAAADKDVPTMLHVLAPLFDKVVLSPYDSPRASVVGDLAKIMANRGWADRTVQAESPEQAVRLARSLAPADGMILVFGSFYLAGEARGLAARRAAESTTLV